MMKVKVEGGYKTREEAERIAEVNKPFYAGEIRQIVSSGEFEIWKPATRMQIDQLSRAKRGDLVRFLVKFTPGASIADKTEFITGVVTSKSGGLLRIKVYSRPEWTSFHSLTYGDELVITESQVVTHESATEQTAKDVEPFITGVIPEPIPINIEDAKLRQATQNLPPLSPVAGKEYWTRNGTLVRVWTYQTQKITACSACNRQLLGNYIQNEMCPSLRTFHDWQERDRAIWIGGTQDGAAIEWNPNGSHAGGIRDLDIVKDPQANEVVA